jgi:hypothetical protein
LLRDGAVVPLAPKTFDTLMALVERIATPFLTRWQIHLLWKQSDEFL